MNAKPLPKQQHLQVVEKTEKTETKIVPVTKSQPYSAMLPKPAEGYLKSKKHDPL